MKELNIVLATLIFISFTSQAASENTTSEITVGLGAQYAPKYTGSDKYDTNVLPYFEWTKGSWFLNSEKGFGYNHQFDNGVYLGQALGYSLGRTDSSSSWFQEGAEKLKGMGKINPAMTTTTTAGWWFTSYLGLNSFAYYRSTLARPC